MSERLRKLRDRVLGKIYETVDGSTSSVMSFEPRDLVELGISTSELWNAIAYLDGEGLAERVTEDHVRITHDGVKMIEGSLREPGPQVVTNLFVNSNVGAVQTGGVGNAVHSSISVTQSSVQHYIEQLEAEVEKAPPNERLKARSCLDAIIALVRALPATAGELKPLLATLAACIPSTAPIVEQLVSRISG